MSFTLRGEMDDDVLQNGYMPAWGVEKALRDVRLNPIYEGTNQINMLALVESFWASDLAGVPYPQIPSTQVRVPGSD
jgi:hypothetical protein